MLLRNIDQSFSMYSGTQLVITHLRAYVLKVRIINLIIQIFKLEYIYLS